MTNLYSPLERELVWRFSVPMPGLMCEISDPTFNALIWSERGVELYLIDGNLVLSQRRTLTSFSEEEVEMTRRDFSV